MNEMDGIAGTGEAPKLVKEVVVNEVRELDLFSKDYSVTGLDFRPHPVGSDVPEPVEPDPAPKDSSAAASADFSSGIIHDAPTELPSPPALPVTTVPVEKDSGQLREPEGSTPTS